MTPPMSPPTQRPSSRTAWWLYYLVVAVLGIYAGVALFDWIVG